MKRVLICGGNVLGLNGDINMSKLIKIIVTGSIGAGKSTACKIFSELGVPVFYSDKESSIIMNNDQNVIDYIKNVFGENIYHEGKLDRKSLGKLVFNDKNRLQQLESIVHPAVSNKFELWIESQKLFNDSKYVIEESAIGIEIGLHEKFDYTIVVTADEDVRIRRTMERDNCSEESVRKRMKNQLPDEEKVNHADFVIVNNDFPNLECQVKSIHKKILESIKK